VKCQNCHAELSIGERFCGECGTARPPTHTEFIQVEEKFLELKKQRRKSELDDASLNAAMQKLVYTDPSGDQWMIGIESEQWHRFEGQEWVRADPPAAATSKDIPEAREARPSPTTSTLEESSVTEERLPARRSPKNCLGISAIALGLLAAGCIITLILGLIYRQQITNQFVNLALEQGWGTVVSTEAPAAASPEAVVTTTKPITPEPKGEMAAPFSRPDYFQLTPIPLPGALPTPNPLWVDAACPAAGVFVRMPPNYTYSLDEDSYAYMRVNADAGLEMWCEPAAHGSTFESEVAWWLDYQQYVLWQQPVSMVTSIGPAALTVGVNDYGDMVFGAVVGPTRDGYVLHFWGLGQDDLWETLVDQYEAIVLSIQYSP